MGDVEADQVVERPGSAVVGDDDWDGMVNGKAHSLPDESHGLYVTNVGHTLHGAYWHSNFGTAMSHGITNLPLDVAARLYEWARNGRR